ncbi:helix-turn-helix domain-containing protein [Sutcliffiella rhizosphaerae]|uniref:HTH cro/C1-type domain-containing protein n=1 Tax=Sutcliffiella rhizosphaerae TaxID=2880967 RepID=A0ABM8YML2_9BACI|nr:helix-turn-helix domain-containing protein [Sutcliffiella rhizosphaerae]CAG9621193.1 hypothetical protein BACCIP111883_01965 [Sutcliffiella rhizosphaerae]
MISNKVLGEEIKRLRKQQLLSQKELADGICCQTTISSIEKGRALPSIDILYFISLRLNVTVDYFLQHNYQSYQLYVSETMDGIEDLLKRKNYSEIYEITKLERKLRKNRDLGSMFNQFIDWHYYRAAQLLGLISWKDSVEQLTLLVQSKEINKVQYQDLKIKNVLANVYSENGETEKALEYYNEILMANIKLESYRRFKLKVYFNLSKLYFYEEDYEESIQVAEKGIKLSIELQDISMLGNLYIQSAQSMILLKKEDAERIKTNLQNAKFIFTLTNKAKSLEFVEQLEEQICSNI